MPFLVVDHHVPVPQTTAANEVSWKTPSSSRGFPASGKATSRIARETAPLPRAGATWPPPGIGLKLCA